MKIVLDTNVLISGFATQAGPSRNVLTKVKAKHLLILSEFILEELKRNLIQKFDLTISRTEEVTATLSENAVVLQIRPNSKIDFSDRNDVPILTLLEVTQAHYLITGDKKLLALKKFGTTLILTPREAVEIL